MQSACASLLPSTMRLRHLKQRSPQRTLRPFAYCPPRASIAARTFGGDIGSSVSRVPTARSIALAIAAIGGQMLTSAAPLAPYGWLGLATSTITGSIIGRSDDTG